MLYTKNKKPILLIFTIFFLLFGSSCTKEESNIDLFYGEWKVKDATWTLTNGISGTIYLQEYYIELNQENCGFKYNLDKEEINGIKWIFQEGKERGEYFFILSNILFSSSGGNDLTKDNLYFVSKLNKDEIRLSRGINRVSNDTTYITYWNLILSKE